VCLKAQTPNRIFKAVAHSALRVHVTTWTVHWLQEEMPKGQALKVPGRRAGLGIYQLNLIARGLKEFSSSLGAHANPIDADRSRNRSVGFYCNFKMTPMQGINQAPVQLQQRFTTCADNESFSRRWTRAFEPSGFHAVCEFGFTLKPASPRAVYANEVRVAELASRAWPIAFAA
jgi:hypothetical protein